MNSSQNQTKSGWKRPKSENCEICSCLLVLSLCLFVLSLCLLVLSSCSDPKIQFWEGVISLDKFFTKSVISGSKCPKSEKLEFWDFGDPRILFLEGFIFLYKFFTKSVISGSKRPKSENCEICLCLLLLARAVPVLACAQPVPAWSPVLSPPNPVLGRCHFPH